MPRPLLYKLVRLFAECCKPEHAVKNGLNTVAIAVLTTPIFLRPIGRPMMSYQPIARERYDAWMLSVTAAGSGMMAFIINHAESTLAPINDELTALQSALSTKCQRLRQLQEQSCQGYAVNLLSEDHELTRLRHLFQLLEPIEKLLDSSTPSQPSSAKLLLEEEGGTPRAAELELSMSDLLTHPRWERCGFLKENPTRDFENNGLLGIDCLIGFLRKYPSNAAAIALELDQPQHLTSFNLGQLSTQIAKLVSQALYLLPHPDSSDRPLPALAKHSSIWRLLNASTAFQEVFNLAMLSLEDSWKLQQSSYSNNHSSPVMSSSSGKGVSHSIKLATSPRQQQTNLIIEVKMILEAVLHQNKPETLEAMWEYWRKIRLLRYESRATSIQQQQQQQRAKGGPTMPGGVVVIGQYSPKAASSSTDKPSTVVVAQAGNSNSNSISPLIKDSDIEELRRVSCS
jgi:hypothetical protein